MAIGGPARLGLGGSAGPIPTIRQMTRSATRQNDVRVGLAMSGLVGPAIARLVAPLQLPPVSPGDQDECDLVLLAGEDGLEIQVPGSRIKPLCCDFLAGTFGYRRSRGRLRHEALARAVGFKEEALDVIDATAGWGRDAAVLALLGCRVRAVERSPVMAALLEDGLRRAQADAEVGRQLADNLAVIRADARTFLAGLAPDDRPDAICIDTMFPPRSKSAGVGKEMQLCRLISGDDDDAAELLEAALAACPRRTVVKRALRSSPLGDLEPSFTLRQRSTRYDVYTARAAAPPYRGKGEVS